MAPLREGASSSPGPGRRYPVIWLHRSPIPLCVSPPSPFLCCSHKASLPRRDHTQPSSALGPVNWLFLCLKRLLSRHPQNQVPHFLPRNRYSAITILASHPPWLPYLKSHPSPSCPPLRPPYPRVFLFSTALIF